MQSSIEGRYSNYFEVGYNAFEIVLSFGQLFEGQPGTVHTRIITNAVYARSLLRLLGDALEEYERKFESAPPGGEGS